MAELGFRQKFIWIQSPYSFYLTIITFWILLVFFVACQEIQSIVDNWKVG